MCFPQPSSALSPLHQGFVLTANGEDILVTVCKRDAHNMLGMTPERERHAAGSARVPEDVDEAEVVASDNVIAVHVAIDSVNVRVVTSLGYDCINVPAELGVASRPKRSSCVGSAVRVLLSNAIFVNLPEEELVSRTVGTDVTAVSTPVESSNCTAVLFQLRAAPCALVDVDGAIVRANCKEPAVWTVMHDFNPFWRDIHDLAAAGKVKCHLSIVARSYDVCTLAGDSS